MENRLSSPTDSTVSGVDVILKQIGGSKTGAGANTRRAEAETCGGHDKTNKPQGKASGTKEKRSVNDGGERAYVDREGKTHPLLISGLRKLSNSTFWELQILTKKKNFR